MVTRLNKKIGIIGGGNMAEAFIHGLLKAGICLASEITVSDVSGQRREYLREEFAVAVTDSNAGCASESDIIIIAVKPVNMGDVLGDIAGRPCKGKLVISIAAGVTLARLEKVLKGAAVIRVMPNTPALIGEGLSVWTRGSRAGREDAEIAQCILGALGREVEIGEALMDAATALSGSGPAYVFYLLEAMEKAGVELGFDPEQARRMAIETAVGAALLAAGSSHDPRELRKRVTSPGGTTAAAVRVLDEAGVKETFIEAIKAARRRAAELSGESY